MGERKSFETKKPHDLKLGDIVIISAYFEENTRMYYNGYHPLEIKNDLVKDAFGRTRKMRPVMVIGMENDKLIYAPLTTTRSHMTTDEIHQYVLGDLKLFDSEFTMKSFLELDSVRHTNVQSHWDIQYIKAIPKEDLNQIMYKLSIRLKRSDPIRDIYRVGQEPYISYYKEELISLGYKKKLSKTGTEHYIKDGHDVHFYQNCGLIKHHHQRTLDDVIKLHTSPSKLNLEDLKAEVLTK